MATETDSGGSAVALGFCVMSVFIGGIAAFITHLWWTLTMLTNEHVITVGKLAIAVLGIIVPPFGALHGVWLWLH